MTLTVDVTKATGFALLRVMKSASPVDRDIALLAVQTSSTFHRTASADPAEFEQAIEYGTIISDVELALFLGVGLHVVRSDLLEEVNVLVSMELCHLQVRRWLRALDESQREPVLNDRNILER